MSGGRGAGGVGEGVEDVLGGGLGGVDAVGDADAVEGDTGQEEPGISGELAADRLDAVEVARVCTGAWPAGWRAIRSKSGSP